MREHIDAIRFKDGMNINGIYVLKEVHVSVAKNGSTYLSGVLSDNSGSIEFRYWDYSGPMTSKDSGSLVYIIGHINVYNEKLQITLESMTSCKPNELTEEQLKAIIPHANICIQERIDYVNRMVESIEDDSIYKITKYLMNKYLDSFTRIPAALSVHHAFINGLLMHTTDMLYMAEQLAKIYKWRVNRSLIVAGVILHDIGKIREFTISPVTGLVSDYSLEGNALGHSIIGVMEIEEAAAAVGADEMTKQLLQNLIASHHGQPEHGAANKPIVIEAEVLHALDMIDSRVEIYKENMRNVPYGEFTPRIYALDNRRVFRHWLDLPETRFEVLT